MNVIKKLSLPLALMAILLVGCYENEEGCQDIFADNFEGAADIPCEDCCTYPDLTLSIQHVLDTFVYSASRKVNNGLGDSFLIIQAGLLLQNVALAQDAGALASTTQRNFQLLDGSTLTATDDFVLARTTTSTYTLGSHMGQGGVNSISLDFGLSAEQEQIDPTALPDAHPLSAESGFRYQGSYISGYADVLYDTITMDTVRYRLPAQLGLTFQQDTAFDIGYGENASLRLKIDYQKWMEGINFVLNGQDEAAVIQAIVNNLPNSISLADE